MTELTYTVKMGYSEHGTLKISMEKRDYLLANQITTTAECFPSSLNVKADWQSSNYKDSNH